ncbi:GTPase Era [Arthrobacter agilis]|uniref:GTPase n=1 Tax=Arthrobacter agilis TaxID=37921 RepID=UPI000B350935|nr:GTPase [Arthrobacter agilis]OUM44231.1 hypothetical protein B8W74_05015 [Arthrobacter agilis]VDR32463.1 GTPase Era [Arthrobacter agilis]
MNRQGKPAGLAAPATTLGRVLDQLREARDLGADRLPEDQFQRLSGVLERAGTRRSLSAAHTVVGVFGPTGSGKSSLVNALSGTDAARVAARRPTTSEPLALVWGRQGSDGLLDWLEVRTRVDLPDGAPLAAAPAVNVGGRVALDERAQDGRGAGSERAVVAERTGEHSGGRQLPPSDGTADDDGVSRTRRRWLRWPRRSRRQRPAGPTPRPPVVPEAVDVTAGLILLDLPDFDSTTLAHREIVQRLAGQVDVLLWVVDPQKYADAALHHDFLRGLATHEAVTLVALNQADRLEPADLAAVTASLSAILAEEGLRNVAVLPVSARTGQGVQELAARIRELAETREAATHRLVADASRTAAELLPFASGGPVTEAAEEARQALAEELGVAAGVGVVVDAVRSSYRRDAHATAGWPVTRWLGRLRPDPLRRLHLRSQDVIPELRSSSLPLAQPAQRARVDHALRVFGDAAAAGAVEPWHTSIRATARGTAEDVTDALDTAVTGTDLETVRRAWWSAFGVAQWLAFAAFVGGLAWLGVLAVLGFFQLPVVDVPRVEGFPVPTLLIVGGLAAGILVGAIAAVFARWGAARRASRVRRRLLAACGGVADDVVLRPVRDEVERYNAFSSTVRSAASGV